ncbi:hypothetical protein WR25_12630 [Diploscapter pachys]|uniref:Uncharacterized protein n=1 Tax=Diploscapter pachys TaxID=2018661 RepID=A0A2A2LYP3_9BILA|nr:hypothetical protein WR25_12630 [Diploscapter pachys]
MQAQHKREGDKEYEFCQAFENICFNIPKSEPDQDTMPKALLKELKPMGQGQDDGSKEKDEKELGIVSPTRLPVNSRKKKINFARFCADFKNRYLYVCPDPFRFGQKAVVFCPIYSEKCHVPLPDRPVLPQTSAGKNKGPRRTMIEKMCTTYRGFAERYCNNPFLTSQTQYRNACDKYWRFCGHRRG